MRPTAKKEAPKGQLGMPSDTLDTKVTFDVNFLDKFHEAASPDRQRILDCLGGGALEFYANEEALRELMGMAHSSRKDKLVAYAGCILQLTRGKILNPPMGLIASELRGAFELQMDEGDRVQLVRFLEQAAGGQIPSAALTIGQRAIDDKERSKQYFDAMFTASEGRFSKLSDMERAKISFDDLQERHWINMGRKTVEQLCMDNGVPDPEKVADRVLADPSKYPHVRFWMKIFTLMLHRYLVLRRRRDRGDLFDLWQMNYLQDMDVYVTEEKKLPGWYEDVFGNSRRVMNWSQFIGEKWC